MWSREGRFEEHRLTKVVPRVEGSCVRSFFFRNFPPTCSDKVLIAKFQEARPVVDRFCPKKRDVAGKRFGFVRLKLDREEDGDALLKKLNSLWLGSYKLRVFTPLFDSGASLKVNPKPIPFTSAISVAGRSFSNVVAGVKQTPKGAVAPI